MAAEALDELVARIVAQPRPLLLAFDVDGTLSPIVDDPQRARVPAAVGAALRRLVKARGVLVALVTGRDAAALSRMVRVPGAYRAVEHGRRILRPGERLRQRAPTAAQRAALSRFDAWAQREAVAHGAELEHKRGSRGLHVRKLARSAPEQAERLLLAAAEVATDCGLHPRKGRAVLEAELEPADKGRAVREIHASTGARGLLFVGDDLTDLPAIAFAVQAGGVGLFVRSPERPEPPGDASGVLNGPPAVATLITKLQLALSRG